MNKKIFTAGVLALGLLLGSCSDDDDNNSVTSNDDNLELAINGLENLGEDFVYEGWIIVDETPVSTGIFTIDDSGVWSASSFSVDETMLANATKFVLTIEPTIDPDPLPSATKIIGAPFTENSATVLANLIPGINTEGDGNFDAPWGKFFLRTPTDELDGNNNGNDENGIWFGTPGTPPTAGLGGMPLLEETSGWRYEGWVVVDGTPISTGTFTTFTEVDSENTFSGIEANDGPPVPGEDFLLNAPDGITFPLDVRGKTAVITLEPFPDNSPKPFSIKPLIVEIDTDAATAPVTHDLEVNLDSFPSGTITRK